MLSGIASTLYHPEFVIILPLDLKSTSPTRVITVVFLSSTGEWTILRSDLQSKSYSALISLSSISARVPTVKALFAREYITKKGKTIYPTQKGEFIINTLPVEEMKSADLTGELEKELNDIAESRTDYQQFVDKVKALTQKWYKTVCGSPSDTFVDKSMICPSCRKRLVKGKTNVFCTGYKSGCNFSIPYSICGKKLTDNQIQMLISSQRTNIIKGFTSKKGKQFDASLKIDNYGKIEFVFPSAKKGKKK